MNIRISKLPDETYTIAGLDSDQYAYITALVGLSNSRVNTEGVEKGLPMMPSTGALYSPLKLQAQKHSLMGKVGLASTAQWSWLRREARTEHRERAS